MQCDIAVPQNQSIIKMDQFAFAIKWAASIIQIFGYAATGIGWTPWNLYLFIVGVLGWFIIGIIWNDRAIMLIHIVALAAMVIGMNNA